MRRKQTRTMNLMIPFTKNSNQDIDIDITEEIYRHLHTLVRDATPTMHINANLPGSSLPMHTTEGVTGRTKPRCQNLRKLPRIQNPTPKSGLGPDQEAAFHLVRSSKTICLTDLGRVLHLHSLPAWLHEQDII